MRFTKTLPKIARLNADHIIIGIIMTIRPLSISIKVSLISFIGVGFNSFTASRYYLAATPGDFGPSSSKKFSLVEFD